MSTWIRTPSFHLRAKSTIICATHPPVAPSTLWERDIRRPLKHANGHIFSNLGVRNNSLFAFKESIVYRQRNNVVVQCELTLTRVFKSWGDSKSERRRFAKLCVTCSDDVSHHRPALINGQWSKCSLASSSCWSAGGSMNYCFLIRQICFIDLSHWLERCPCMRAKRQYFRSFSRSDPITLWGPGSRSDAPGRNAVSIRWSEIMREWTVIWSRHIVLMILALRLEIEGGSRKFFSPS